MPLSEVKPFSFVGESENIIRNAAFSTSWFLVSNGISSNTYVKNVHRDYMF